MSQKYEDFAKETYRTFYENMEQGLAEAEESGKPLLVVSGEAHFSKDDAYSHIAGLAAAINLVGTDKVTLSLEIPPNLINWFFQNAETTIDKALNINHPQLGRPMTKSLAYAIDKNIDVERTDTNRQGVQTLEQLLHPLRLDGEIVSIGQIPSENPDAKIVFHIGGAYHLFTLAGYQTHDRLNDYSQINQLPSIAPFQRDYAKVLMFNSAEPNCENETTINCDFANAHANAIQIKNPGPMDRDDRDYNTIVARIEAAATNYRPITENAAPELTGAAGFFAKPR